MLRRADLSKSLPLTPLRFLVAELAVPALQLTLLGYLSLTLMMLTGKRQRTASSRRLCCLPHRRDYASCWFRPPSSCSIRSKTTPPSTLSAIMLGLLVSGLRHRPSGRDRRPCSRSWRGAYPLVVGLGAALVNLTRSSVAVLSARRRTLGALRPDGLRRNSCLSRYLPRCPKIANVLATRIPCLQVLHEFARCQPLVSSPSERSASLISCCSTLRRQSRNPVLLDQRRIAPGTRLFQPIRARALQTALQLQAAYRGSCG